MKKLLIRSISILMAITLVMSSVPFLSYGAEVVYAKLSADGKTYSRLSDGVYIDFTTDFDEVVELFKTSMLNRESDFSIKFATCDPVYVDSGDIASIGNKIINHALVGAFAYDTENPYAGDFLYHSLNMSAGGFSPAYTTYHSDRDVIDGVEYYAFEIGLHDVNYFSTVEQDDFFHKFVSKFNEQYISADDTDYEKVKIIYDFVVRNTTYDEGVYRGNIDKNSIRFRSAHTAYGAICGNIFVDDSKPHFDEQLASGTLDFDGMFDEYFSPAMTVEGQKVEDQNDWGLAVCEGYSKLFYALCISNGLKCHIVDGDYATGVLDKNGTQRVDPHEWNYVYLQDEDDEHPKWYQIDTTYASQRSIKEVEYNSYDFFLVGTDNDSFSKDNHQIPYQYEVDENGVPYIYHFDGHENTIEHQLYDWESNEYRASVSDYDYPSFNFLSISDASADVKNNVLIIRKYTYKGEEREGYVLIGKNENGDFSSVRVEINEAGHIVYKDNVLEEDMGFPYRSIENMEYRYHFIIPYIVNTERVDVTVNSSETKMLVNAGTYPVRIGDSDFVINVPITALNMSNDENHQDNYESIQVDNESGFMGSEIVPEATITDGYGYRLVPGKDYDIVIYDDPEHIYKLDKIEDIGEYFIGIEYKGNYKGSYNLVFTVGKADMSLLENKTFHYEYLPKSLRQQAGITNIGEYYASGATGMTIGKYNVKVGEDYTVNYESSSSDSMKYGTSGNIVLTGTKNSTCFANGTRKKYPYYIDKQFDIGNSKNGFNGMPANSKKTYTYTGSPIKPNDADDFDNLKKALASDEYTIAGYENNVNPGDATVIIDGKGGCKGTAKMSFRIKKKPITTDMIDYSVGNGNIYIDISYNGMMLKRGVDYTITKQTDKIRITATSDSNYTGNFDFNGTGINKLNVVCTCYHVYKTVTTKATTTKNGSIQTKCSECGKVKSTTTIAYPKTITLSATKYTYDGNAKKPTVTVKDSNGNKIASTNYTVTYSNNTVVGKATVKITFKGNYSGTVSKTFTIVPKSTTISSLSAVSKGFAVKWKKQATQTTGYQIQIATNSGFTKGVKNYTVSKNSTVSKKITSLTAKKKYYVRIRTYKTVNSTKYYSAWSGSKSITTK